MGKTSRKPNAPELQQILLSTPNQQLPYNPYQQHTSHFEPPPSYSNTANSVPLNRFNSLDPQQVNMNNYQHLSSDNGNQARVIIQQRPIQYDSRDKRHKKVKEFNREMIFLSLFVIISSVCSHQLLWTKRQCLVNFTVAQSGKDLTIRIFDVRDGHLYVAYASCVIFFLALIKSAVGRSSNYGCYLFIMGFGALIVALYAGCLAFLSYHAPCTPDTERLVSEAGKTAINLMGLTPDKPTIGEKSVFDYMKEDTYGVWIFGINVVNFALYLSAFIASTFLC